MYESVYQASTTYTFYQLGLLGKQKSCSKRRIKILLNEHYKWQKNKTKQKTVLTKNPIAQKMWYNRENPQRMTWVLKESSTLRKKLLYFPLRKQFPIFKTSWLALTLN